MAPRDSLSVASPMPAFIASLRARLLPPYIPQLARASSTDCHRRVCSCRGSCRHNAVLRGCLGVLLLEARCTTKVAVKLLVQHGLDGIRTHVLLELLVQVFLCHAPFAALSLALVA